MRTRTVLGGAQHRRELRCRAAADRAATAGSRASPSAGLAVSASSIAGQRLGQFVAADIEGAQRHRPALHAAHQAGEELVLLVLARQLLAVHVEELGAHQAQRPSRRWRARARVRPAVRDWLRGGSRYRRGSPPAAAAAAPDAAARAASCLAPGAVVRDGLRARVDDDDARGAVDQHRRIGRAPRPAAPGPPSTAGNPSARAMIAVWPSGPPNSAAKPPIRRGSISAVSPGRDLLRQNDRAAGQRSNRRRKAS